MSKVNTIKEQLLSLQQSEGGYFVFDKLRLATDLEKYENPSLIIKVITILGAFLGSGFLLGFTFAIQLFQGPLSMIILGITLIIISIALSNKSKLLLFETSFIALLIYGGLLLELGLNELKINENVSCLILFLAGVIVFLISKNEIQILLGVIAASLCIIWLINLQKLFFLFHAINFLLTFGLVYIYFNEAQLITNPFFARRYSALKTGLLLVFLIGMARVSIKELNIKEIQLNWVSGIAPILAIAYILGRIFKERVIQSQSSVLLIKIITSLILLLTIVFPAISASIVVILLCFYINYKTGFFIAVLSLVYFIGQFYYDLSFTLLVKSELLFATGLLFGCIYFFSSKKLSENEEI